MVCIDGVFANILSVLRLEIDELLGFVIKRSRSPHDLYTKNNITGLFFAIIPA